MTVIRGLQMDTTPLYKVDANKVGREAQQGMERVMGLQRMQQPNIPEPEQTVGQGLMTGLGGAAAGAQVATTAFKGLASAGPAGAAIGTGIGLLSAFG